MKTIRACGMLSMMVLAGSIVYAETINGIDMDFTTIADDGNVADATGYGAVDYSYRIGVSEVSIGQFQGALGAGSGNENLWVDADAPAVMINFLEAAQFCNFLTSGDVNSGAYTISGGQVTAIMSRSAMLGDGGTFYVLPTEDEWYKAAYYKDGVYSLYANGTATIPVAGVDANYGGTASPWSVGTGAVEQNGTRNMMGNVWEWTESAYDESLEMPVAENMLFRGGAYNNDASKLESLTASQDTYTLQHESVGMRVVVIPEPGTISLMSLSTVGLFMTRSIRRRKRLGQSLMPVRRARRCDSFISENEWTSAVDVEAGDHLGVLLGVVADGCSKLKGDVAQAYESLDKAFWNRMVAVHERRVARRTAVRQTLRKRALDGLDAFLALIMK